MDASHLHRIAEWVLFFARRACFPGSRGSGYAQELRRSWLLADAFSSQCRAAVFGADVVGSQLADNKWPFSTLVYLNAGTTAIVLVLLPFLPAALMQSKDKAANTPERDGATTVQG